MLVSQRGGSITVPVILKACAVAFAGLPALAFAQAVPSQTGLGSRQASVTARVASGYEAIGIDVGGFTLFPTTTINTGYDTNIYASSRIEVADAFVTLAPRMTARSQWGRHRLSIVADANIQRYAERTIANSTQYGAQADGVLDIGSQTQVTLRGTIAQRIEPRGTEGDTFIGGAPIGYRVITSYASLQQQLGAFGLQVGGNYSVFRYGRTRVANQVADLSFRDFRSVGLDGRIGYHVSASVAPYVSISYNKASYPESSRTIDRDSHGYQLLGGVAVELTSLLVGQVGIGYISQKFGNAVFSDVGGFNYRGSLVWTPTTLSTVTLQANRSLQRGPTIGVAGVIQSEVRVGVDHELLRNLILHADVGYFDVGYRGIDRSDNRLNGGVSARYALNRNLSITLSEAYSRQRPGGASITGRSYDRHQLNAGVAIQL